MAWSSFVLYILCQQETNFSRESVPGECRHDKDGHLNFYLNCAGKELRQALLPFIANAMSCLPSEQDKPEVIDLLKKAGIVFALKDNKVALNLKAIEDVFETTQVQQHKKHYGTHCYTNTERLIQQKEAFAYHCINGDDGGSLAGIQQLYEISPVVISLEVPNTHL